MKIADALTSFFLLIVPTPAWGFLDTIAQTARDAAKAVAYVGAMSELATTIDDTNNASRGVADLSARVNALNLQGQDIYYLSDDLRTSVVNRDWSKASLESNIAFTTQFVASLKRFFISMGLLGADVATAMNTAETNSALNQVLKNQQAQILLERENQIDAVAEKIHEQATWEDFISRERKLRDSSSASSITP